MVERTERAWAVKVKWPGPPLQEHLCGRSYFRLPDDAHAGCPVSLFDTRARARAAAKKTDGRDSLTYPWPRASVVRVEVTIRELPK